MSDKLNIGIIVSSTRQGRVGRSVAEWVLEKASTNADATYSVVDIRDFDLPFLGTTKDMTQVAKWNEALSTYDGFIFVVAEYNHSITGALKNALDSARDPWINKAAGIVSYGSAGGARASEHLRGILNELQVADVRTHILLSLFTDFKDGVFKPSDAHDANLVVLFEQVNAWSKALKSLR
ncbi:MAG: NADPH-dependent FMN reductase [Candidatus Izemoplasmataceae bacterium]